MSGEFKIPQIPFAFQFDCDRPNGDSATVCHHYHSLVFGKSQSNGQMAIP